jgi:hypothetical protein
MLADLDLLLTAVFCTADESDAVGVDTTASRPGQPTEKANKYDVPGDFGNDSSSLSKPGPARGTCLPRIVADSDPDQVVVPSASLARVPVP